MQTVARRIAALRAARQISQAQLAKEVGVSQPTIANIERGRTKLIKGYVLEGLARALNTTGDYILLGDMSADAADTAAQQSELVGTWHKLPPAMRDTLLQTARGLLKAAEINPPSLPSPARSREAGKKNSHALSR